LGIARIIRNIFIYLNFFFGCSSPVAIFTGSSTFLFNVVTVGDSIGDSVEETGYSFDDGSTVEALTGDTFLEPLLAFFGVF
jgi:hypothetical protein